MVEISSSLSENPILKFEFGDFVVFYNCSNGKVVNVHKNDLGYKDIILANNAFYEAGSKCSQYTKVYIGVNISTYCNLKCKYCFSQDKEEHRLDIKIIEDFIKYIVNEKTEAHKFFVDMSGSAKRLLKVKLQSNSHR